MQQSVKCVVGLNSLQFALGCLNWIYGHIYCIRDNWFHPSWRHLPAEHQPPFATHPHRVLRLLFLNQIIGMHWLQSTFDVDLCTDLQSSAKSICIVIVSNHSEFAIFRRLLAKMTQIFWMDVCLPKLNEKICAQIKSVHRLLVSVTAPMWAWTGTRKCDATLHSR